MILCLGTRLAESQDTTSLLHYPNHKTHLRVGEKRVPARRCSHGRYLVSKYQVQMGMGNRLQNSRLSYLKDVHNERSSVVEKQLPTVLV